MSANLDHRDKPSKMDHAGGSATTDRSGDRSGKRVPNGSPAVVRPGRPVYGLTPAHLTRDGQPWLPMMGEIHYSRLPQREWARCLATMKAGGVDIASSYVIWIHHEEARGRVHFDEDLDLRRFIGLVGDAGLLSWLRVGPWVHAEVRNGGLPDWMMSLDFEPRTNDERYFVEIERFYRLIFNQVDGLFVHQSGPIVGIQIENEYGHCGGLAGEAGETHMRRLTSIARQVGFDVPYFSATGWGGAVTGGLLPVMGGYADAPWDQRQGAIEPSGNFVFTPERDDHAIGSDFDHGRQVEASEGPGKHRPTRAVGDDNRAVTVAVQCELMTDRPDPAVGGDDDPSSNETTTADRHESGIDQIGASLTFDMTRFPYLTAELGGGLQVTHHRRPIARARDAAAMSVVKLGSGASLLGYYMYHGGLNPNGELTTLQESRASGSFNDLPVKSYDFRAPLGAYDQINDTWHELRLLAMFLHDFGADLGPMTTIFPDSNPLDPADRTHPRHTIRHNGSWGFVFVNNHVRGTERPWFRDVRIHALGHDLPPFDLGPGSFGIYPFNMPVHGGVVRFATATPLCRVGTTTVFYGDSIDATAGADVRLITPAQARQAYLVDGRLVFSEDPIIDGRRRVTRRADELTVQIDELTECPPAASRLGTRRWCVRLDGYDRSAEDYTLRVRWRGDTIRFFVPDHETGAIDQSGEHRQTLSAAASHLVDDDF